jgi:histidyl-tRNA synthetase
MCDKDQIPLCVIIGEDELAKGELKVKDMKQKDESQGGGKTIKREEMIDYIKERLGRK